VNKTFFSINFHVFFFFFFNIVIHLFKIPHFPVKMLNFSLYYAYTYKRSD
jgi:hypothetical protein